MRSSSGTFSLRWIAMTLLRRSASSDLERATAGVQLQRRLQRRGIPAGIDDEVERQLLDARLAQRLAEGRIEELLTHVERAAGNALVLGHFLAALDRDDAAQAQRILRSRACDRRRSAPASPSAARNPCRDRRRSRTAAP